MAFLYLCRWQP